MKLKILIISNLWVEPASSAAGRRMLQIIDFFSGQDCRITYATTARKSEYAFDLSDKGEETVHVRVNDPAIEPFLLDLQPDIVVFDRFMAEEQFGWRVANLLPGALRILDTEDLHCLRYARETALKEGRAFHERDLMRDIAYREIASVYRCDLSLMISSFEMALMQRVFGVETHLLHYLPFLEQRLGVSDMDRWLGFENREDFVSIGNFRHPPNADSVHYLKEAIWPLIRKELGGATLHIYGAYAHPTIRNMGNESEGFLVHGRARDAGEVIGKARLMLAPLRFGAGLKGKLIDAMRFGTPSITTGIGAEGMAEALPWPGAVEDDPEAFARAAVELYHSPSKWKLAQKQGMAVINERFAFEAHALLFQRKLENILGSIDARRAKNFTGQMLMHHSLKSTEYMARWIEEKNRSQ